NLPVYKNKSTMPLPQDLQRLRKNAPLLSVYKDNRRSTVHRSVPMDIVAVKTFDKDGNVKGEKLFIGLFTSVTYSRSVYDVPLLRRKVRQVIADIKFAPNSHDFRALAHILEKYPRDELFQMPVEQIRSHMVGNLRLQDRPRVALYPRVDPFRRYVSCLLYVPRERYGTALRMTIQDILERELDGYCENFYTTLDDSPLARVIFIITTDQRIQKQHDFHAIERKIVAAARIWPERLREAIMEATPDERQAIALSLEYDDAFPVAYQDYYTPEEAIGDITKIEEAIHAHRIALDLYQVPQDGINAYRLKLYHQRHAVSLSDVLPILENMGFIVEAEFPFEVTPQEGGRIVWIQEFHLRLRGGRPAGKLVDVKSQVETALMSVWYGQAESDPLNSLILVSGLDWRDVVVLRTYVKYMQQAAVPYSPAYIMQALTDYPMISAGLVGLFHALNDPNIPDAKRKIKTWESAILQGLESVDRLDQDRILRFMKSLVDATLRTNFYQVDENGHPKAWLSIKLDSAKIDALPDPRPWREIFVYSPRMEGIHLRGGKIARGGIRWSDRAEDFRTEILGLMQAQMVKNSIIVPEGAKGGFILKKPPISGDRQALQAEGIACYQTLVRGMLDITDNRKGDKIIHPDNVIRHDGDDPYLVVAADKGTATFSDIANALSQDYGFWLDDAFASGGSAGYDHKEIGITARGAWECIKRHFRELGNDIQQQDFDVIGVGDMAGDVFGNGMLLSKHIRLIGAFNHQHIFCDPDPDSARTWKERDRLFKAVKGWGDYDQSLLSKGGKIYLRSEKSLALTKEIRARFGIEAEKVTPAELIQAMLKTKCDLLYFGGIGTYIKGAAQTDAEVGDRTNDALRVNATDINARVVGEGANLAVTRRARIELGNRGIKLNADYVDNSGGVDCSDHEVNIKILLQEVDLNTKDRNKLLGKMTDEVAGLVLRNSYQQSEAISLTELDGAAALTTQNRFIELMEREDGLKRRVEGLPTPAEFDQFNASHTGLTRPVLATLISLSKLRLYKALMATDLPDDPLAQIWLMDYFPTPLRKNYVPAIKKHRLRREIIAKQMTASLVNRLGPTFMMTMADKTGASVADIARAVFIARESFDLRSLWYALESLDGKVPASVQLKSMKQIARLIEYLTLWFLRHGRELMGNGNLAKTAESLNSGIAAIRDAFQMVLPESRLVRINTHVDTAMESGLPKDIALNLAYLNPLRSAPDIIRIAGNDAKKIPTTAKLFFHIGEALHFDWLRQQARLLSGSSFWQAEAIDGVIGQLYTTQANLTR
ncbi:MAG TPA: NAD-glutamate dehydrogenase, partial [Alphaproteobacteria bacterium]